MSIITLTTDFGTGSPYVAAIKGVILSINPTATLVDVTHEVRPQDVRHGALVLGDVAGRFPPETIHVAVVDPGVGTERAVVYARIGRRGFIAPDNGLLWPLSRRTPPSKLIRLAESQYWLEPVSATFHGRDVMAPVAARLSLGLDPERLGPPHQRLVELDWPEPEVTPGKIAGEVIDVDSFGNLITNVTAEMLAGVPTQSRVRVTCGKHEVDGIAKTYGDRAPGELVGLIGSGGRLELAVVAGDAAARFGLSVGTPVMVCCDKAGSG